MASHAWLTRPSEQKAERLASFIDYALVNGASHKQSEVFAGYCLEAQLQGGTRLTVEGLFAGASKAWKILTGKNAANYQRVVDLHRGFLSASLIVLVWDKIRNEDLDFIGTLSCRQHFLPFVDLETLR